MRRSTLNFLVDTLILSLIAAIVSTGLIMAFLLPPGSGRSDVEPMGRGAGERSISMLWGMSRHEWGDLHWWLSVALIVGALLHLVLHWRWIVAMITRPALDLTDAQRRRRSVVAVLAVLLIAAVIAAPWFAPIHSTPRLTTTTSATATGEHGGDEMIRGSVTLREVEEMTGMPVDALLRALDLPADTSPEMRLGPLRREHGFEMSAVRDVVSQWRQSSAPE